MPFTPSHIAAVLPFARTPLAPAALSIGSMAPDILYFFPGDIDRAFTHSLHGAISIDVVVGLLTFAAWVLLLRQAALDYAPAWVRERMSVRPRWRTRGWWLSVLLVVAALELGILTHLFFDAITHEGGPFDRIAPWFGTEIGAISVANLIHAAVSISMGIIIALWVRRWVVRTPREHRPTRLRRGERPLIWLTLCALLAVACTLRWVFLVRLGRIPYDPDVLARAFFVGAGVTGAVAVLLAIAWHLRKAR